MNPVTDSWTNKTAMPFPVHTYASAVVDNKIHIIGGSSNTAVRNFTQIYDPETDTWSQGKPIPIAVYGTAAGATTGEYASKRIYVIGGETATGPNQLSTNITQIYDPATDTWTTGTSMLTHRFRACVAVVDDVLYAIGGYQTEPMDQVAVNEQYLPPDYVPEFLAWTVLPLLLVVSLFVVLFKKRLTCVKSGALKQFI